MQTHANKRTTPLLQKQEEAVVFDGEDDPIFWLVELCLCICVIIKSASQGKHTHTHTLHP